jgi:hypothetical protein
MERTWTEKDRQILRELARRIVEIASLPVMETRRRLWVEHNSLRSRRPMMLIFPEGAWEELLPKESMTCETEFARTVERGLSMRIYTFEHFQDDSVIEAGWVDEDWLALGHTGWGVDIQRRPSTAARGAWAFEPVIRDEADLKQLHYPDLVYDEARITLNTVRMNDLFGDILSVKPAGIRHIGYGLMSTYSDWCGLERMMTDMLDRPDFMHRVLSFITAGHQHLLKQWQEANLLRLNNDNTYHSSGGNGFTDQLPAPGFDPAHVRPIDLWASAQSQELAQVSPRMHREFALRYEKELLLPFGLAGYGCCEDLGKKLEDVLTIPNIRRVSISPFADVDLCAAKLKDQAIFSWKPHPSQLVGEFNEGQIRSTIRHTLDVTRENGCTLEMILKDTHTCEFHPERFDCWTRIAREEIKNVS